MPRVAIRHGSCGARRPVARAEDSTAILTTDSIPLTANGKVDVGRLPKPARRFAPAHAGLGSRPTSTLPFAVNGSSPS
ncbi:hypothetical protein GS497_26070 [Rhodococcus hoagii]|nr:hypothetical protein [Prescottella equi]